jgi:outer membrane immunogenic protein
MKKLFVAGIAAAAFCGAPALAADLPVKAPAYKAVAPMFNWTGFYVGGHVGWAWVRASTTIVSDPSGAFPPGFNFCCDRDGFIGGAQAGFNWQTGQWVFGVEGDWSWTNSSRVVISTSPTIPGVVRTATADDHWYATATGRIGYARDNWLLYAKGGAAWFSETDGNPSTTGLPVGTTVAADVDHIHLGWTVGAGIEWALWPNWSAKIEYNYMDFGTERVRYVIVSPPAAAGTFGEADLPNKVHAVKVGLNYRFDWGKGPVAARY